MFIFLVKFLIFVSGCGALNLGLIAFFQVDLVKRFSNCFKVTNLDKILYGFIAFAGLFSILFLFVAR
jgi:uncharacterized membrane protein YuzA (DUF378 family)